MLFSLLHNMRLLRLRRWIPISYWNEVIIVGMTEGVVDTFHNTISSTQNTVFMVSNISTLSKNNSDFSKYKSDGDDNNNAPNDDNDDDFGINIESGSNYVREYRIK